MNQNQPKYLLTLDKCGQIYLIVISIIILFSTILPAQNPFDKIKIGIVFSEKTWSEVHPGDDNYYFINDWELFFMDRKIPYRVYTDDELDDYNFEDEDILILPGVEILSDDAVENIKDFVNAGKSIFIIGDLGTYKPGLRKRFDNVCYELTGITPIELFNSKQTTTTITLNPNNPFINEPINQNLILSGNLNNYCTNRESDFFTIGYYSDSNSTTYNLQSSIVCGSKKNSRFAWSGFQISQISGGLKKNSIAEKIILNILKFLGNKTLVSINNFPAEFNQAVVFINKLKDGKKFQNFVRGINSLNNITFDNFISPESLEKNKFDLNYLKAFGDIHLVYNNIDFLNMSVGEINNLYHNAGNDIEVSTGQNSIGILDESPFISNFESNPVEFKNFQFRMNDNIIKINSSSRIIPFRKISGLFTDDGTIKEDKFENILSDGQIFVIPVINEFNSSFNLTIDEFQSLQIKLTKNNCWLTTLNQLTNWSELKSNISFNVNSYEDKKTIEIVVRNNNYKSINDLSFNLILPEEYTNASTSEFGSSIYFDYSKHVYRLVIKDLEANQEKRIIISE